ncbi:hypothetical protein POM88_026517 [Heracleum sosnowskyi]|uniref:Uncharacterized protein n=1 Tax=Heracleum sosnowskyi TaxID=360622 RepID=A0AAD8MQ22_9APIA|nr:hypothetical protein POM88_026517 [Heracleum sosnowskyi]
MKSSNYERSCSDTNEEGDEYNEKHLKRYLKITAAYEAPAPTSYPAKDGAGAPEAIAGTVETETRRGYGFWKGCCVALWLKSMDVQCVLIELDHLVELLLVLYV